MLRVLSDALTTADDRQVTLIALRAGSVVSIRLCRSRAASTPTAVQLRLHRRRAALDDVVRFLPDATGFLRRSSCRPFVQYSSAFHSGPSSAPILRPVHCRLEQGHIASHGLRCIMQYADDCQVCVTTSVDDAALAVDRLARCVADVGACK